MHAKKVARSDSQKKEKRQRTLSIKTRKHTPSFKEKFKLAGTLPPAEMEGMLERKQELQGGGKKATIRSWKYNYTVLCGQLLCFFKDKQGICCLVQYCTEPSCNFFCCSVH
jgi:spectrin beta